MSELSDVIMLFTQAEPGDQITVAIYILVLQVIQQLAALIDHTQQTLPGVVVFLVYLEMFGQTGDIRRQQCDLYFRGTGIRCGTLILANDAGYLLLI